MNMTLSKHYKYELKIPLGIMDIMTNNDKHVKHNMENCQSHKNNARKAQGPE